MNSNIQFYRLRCITNLHVGSGETSYSLIDGLIERDVATDFPCINSSGLKGAIKQKFAHLDPDILRNVFGSDVYRNKLRKKSSEESNEDNTRQGACHFLSARLLAIPVRSDIIPYFLATSPALVLDFLSLWEDLYGKPYPDGNNLISVEGSEFFSSAHKDADIGQTGQPLRGLIKDDKLVSALRKLLGTDHPLVIISDSLIRELTDDNNLPVIARNTLEDGQSRNLWYEQVLPRESIMYFPIVWNSVSPLNIENGILQVGGNASVGYGFTKISEIK